VKILLVNGSPRKKNTFNILKTIQEDFNLKQYETEIITLSDYVIKSCVGCYKCVLDGKEKCPLKDDVDNIWRKFLEADGIVLSAPVYALGVPGTFKNFIDRVAYNAHRPLMYNKPTIIVSTTAGMGTEKVIEQLKWFEISGLKIIGAKGFMIYPIGEATPKIADSNAKSLKMLIKKLEHEMAKEKEKKPTLLQIIQFYGLKLNCNFGKDVYKADYEYFQHKQYHKEIKINPVKELFGKILYKIGTAALRSSVNLEKRT